MGKRAYDSKGYKVWRGGDFPVDIDPWTTVYVKFRGGGTNIGDATLFRWKHLNSADDIVGYKPA